MHGSPYCLVYYAIMHAVQCLLRLYKCMALYVMNPQLLPSSLLILPIGSDVGRNA